MFIEALTDKETRLRLTVFLFRTVQQDLNRPFMKFRFVTI